MMLARRLIFRVVKVLDLLLLLLLLLMLMLTLMILPSLVPLKSFILKLRLIPAAIDIATNAMVLQEIEVMA